MPGPGWARRRGGPRCPIQAAIAHPAGATVPLPDQGAEMASTPAPPATTRRIMTPPTSKPIGARIRTAGADGSALPVPRSGRPAHWGHSAQPVLVGLT